VRPAALAVLLTLCVPVQLLGQRATGNPSPSSSSSSGGSGGGGGYSGGGSHSSGASSSGGGGARSGGSSSGSSSSGGSRSTGSAGPNNSGAHSGSAHSTTTPGSPQSNMRTGNAGSERWSSANSGSNGGPAFSRPTSQVVPIQQQQWILEALRLNTTSANLKSDLPNGKIDAQLKGFGVAPNKAAYREQVNKLDAVDISQKQPGWFAKHILGKQDKQQVALSPTPRPCPGEECKPIVLPPKPCVGKNCKPTPPPVNPPPPPVSGICLSGIPTRTGGCAPWGYFDRCGRGTCYLQLAAVDSSYCDNILNRIRREEASTISLEAQQRLVCSSDPQSPACVSSSQELQQTHTRIDQLRRQYQMCLMSTGWQSVRHP